MPGAEAAVSAAVRNELKSRRYVVVSGATIRKLHQQGIQFSMV